MGFLSAVIRTDTAVDLGTVHARIFVPEQGSYFCAPSVVMVSRRNGRVLAIGNDALIGGELGWRDVELVRPIKNGAVADYDAAVALVRWLLATAHGRRPRVRPQVAVAVPAGAANMERRVLEEVVKEAGARKVVLVDQGLAAGLGHQSDDAGISARMVADFGGRSVEMAIVAHGRAWAQRTLPLGGERLDQAVIDWALREYRMVLSDRMAGRVRLNSAVLAHDEGEYTPVAICGQDALSGRPVVHTVAAGEITGAMTPVLDRIAVELKELRASCDPELIGQLLTRGLALSGGGALLPGLPTLLAQRLDMPVHMNASPDQTVVVGAARYLHGPWANAPKKPRVTLGEKTMIVASATE
ncbi:rod shape-determining protein [Actinomadura hibisca]|uniref:rod shape-determining protein n=1 Tax=Actinomadura hibisca TaxID=68565 RepID=UPI000AA3C2A2|nr:rod shape-determining protein [Actinomadura hibisca]